MYYKQPDKVTKLLTKLAWKQGKHLPTELTDNSLYVLSCNVTDCNIVHTGI